MDSYQLNEVLTSDKGLAYLKIRFLHEKVSERIEVLHVIMDLRIFQNFCQTSFRFNVKFLAVENICMQRGATFAFSISF